MKKIILILAAAVFCLSDFAFAANLDAGKSAYTFLKIGVSAKAQGMGGAYAGFANDLSGLYYNPAGIVARNYVFTKRQTQIDYGFEEEEDNESETGYDVSAVDPAENRFLATYMNYLLDFKTGYLGYARLIDKATAIGVSIHYMNYGEFDRLDVQGNQDGTFGASDIAIGLTYAKVLLRGFYGGFTGKFISEKIDNYSSAAIAADFGIQYRFGGGRSGLGLAVTNAGVQTKGFSKSHKDPLPVTVDAGFSHALKGLPLTIAVDLIKPSDNDFFLALGGQFDILKPFMLRLGWSSAGKDFKTGSDRDNLAGFAGGFGYSYQNYVFDYSYSSYADLGNVHRLTLGVDF